MTMINRASSSPTSQAISARERRGFVKGCWPIASVVNVGSPQASTAQHAAY
jgi:hypothetical protein